ncbi:hypothetical protein chiPu_0001196 [Chiloscyllium punctatum]|uniref:Uncharacterized protein n=1 Tax=Chiloscyllium punctatum TaxID=137246 RepID=A0A401RXD5_CHIPU|nr:hypothetical protein [Chiloscyllium punctatum]
MGMVKAVKPFLSRNQSEANRWVQNLHRIWHWEVPDTVQKYSLDISMKHGEYNKWGMFMRNANVADSQVTDLLSKIDLKKL